MEAIAVKEMKENANRDGGKSDEQNRRAMLNCLRREERWPAVKDASDNRNWKGRN